MLIRQRNRTAPIGGKASGAVVLLAIVTLLSLMLSTIAAMTGLMLSARHTVAWRLEREIAFRQAEVALMDAEADLRAAFADPRRRRLSPLPAAGACGRIIQQGLCTPSPAVAPPWEPWLAASPGLPETGVAVGTFTGVRMPMIPADMGGTVHPPRYLLEALGDTRPAPSPGTPGMAADPASTLPLVFRITAIGHGRDPAARVVLQTHWRAPNDAVGLGQAGRRIGWRELVPAP